MKCCLDSFFYQIMLGQKESKRILKRKLVRPKNKNVEKNRPKIKIPSFLHLMCYIYVNIDFNCISILMWYMNMNSLV